MFFSLNPLVQEQMPQLAQKISKIDSDLVPERILEYLSSQNGKESQKKVLQELLHLPSPIIQKYVKDAFNHDWPFLPPTINPTIMKVQNAEIPVLTEIELLLLCLNFAFESEEYKLALSIAFVVDRFVYWCDGSVALLKIIDQIQKLAPSTPVAPQLAIRKARVLKDNGDLHGSIQILNTLIDQKWEDVPTDDSSSRWQYKTEDQYINVCAVCIQIKGQIYHNLGLWKEAITPLMESIKGFKKLPVEDFKGTSFSYSLISRCLRQLSRREYRDLCKEYSFLYDHHYYQAYSYGIEAFKTSPGQRLFMSKHLLQSGECLLMYAVQLTDGDFQCKMFRKILRLLVLVVSYQNKEEFSQSKDQLFVFIKTLFVISLTLGCSFNHLDRDMSHYLENISMFVYEKFCEIGVNQLDSEIGKKKLQEIAPAFSNALTKLCEQYEKVGVTATKGDTHPVDITKIIDDIINPEADIQERLHLLRVKTKKIGKPKENTIEDCKTDTHGETREKVTPIVDCKVDSQEKVKISEKKRPTPDCNKDTQEKVETPEKMTPIVDCNKDTRERVETPEKMTPIVDCNKDTRERVETPEKMTPIVDCNKDTQERAETPEKIIPIVDCNKDTRERVETPEKMIPIVDCNKDTQERLETPGKMISIVDCNKDTRERVETPEKMTPIVDCNNDTRERVETPEKMTPIVDCNKDTRERVETPEKMIPIVDCNKDTRERVETHEKMIPIVDCNKDTRERVETPEKMIPIVDCNKDTRERVETPEKMIPIVDCNKDTRERVETPKKMIPIVDCNKDTRERVETPEKMIPIVDCNKDTRERVETPEKMIPIVDCNKDTRERVETPKKMIPIVDCNKDTRERVETPEKMIPIVDCNKDTRERVETPKKMIPIVDCNKDTRERVETPEKMIPIVDCNKDTRERVETPEKMIPIVNCNKDTRERVETPKKMIPIVDCNKDTRERIETPEKMIPIVDCNKDTRERVETPEKMILIVDCNKDTRERVETPAKIIPIVDCNKDTRERVETPEKMIPIVDCNKDTRERVETPKKMIPIVDCNKDTRERVETPEKMIPIVDCNKDTRERVETPEKMIPIVDCNKDTRERVETPKKMIPIVDCNKDTRERIETPEKMIPIVDCNKDTRERVETPEKMIPIVDCNKDTRERVETPAKIIPIVDCNKDTPQSVETPEKMTPIVDCNKDTQERVETPEKMIPIIDCNNDTRERVETPEKMIPIVDCNKDTRERVETPEKMTPIVDCNKDTRERVETPEKMIPIVDCNKDTRERVETPEKMIPIVDCNKDTWENLETPEKMIPIVDCNIVTRERVETPEKMIPIVDCNKDTRERVETPGKMTPIVDSKIDTQDRVEAPEKMTPIVDYKVDTRDSVEMPEKSKPIVDCQVNSQDGGCTNISSYDSGFASFGSLSAGLNHNSLLKPRIVGLPSRVSDIERKVSSLAKFCRKVNDFNPDTDASAVQNEDASLVNLSALTAMRQSKKDGTFSANRLLNKFQRQVSFANEPQVNIPSSRTDELESSSSYLGKYLQMLVSKDLLLSTTNFPCQGFKRTIDSTDKDVRVNKVQKATLYQYNPVTGVWSGQDTLVCTGKELTLGKGKKGSFRNVYEITFLHQDEPLGKYVSKRYREQKEPLHYMDDIVCQMQAGLYVNLFNQALKTFELDLRIYFLTAAYMLLYDSQGNVKDWLNIEPYVDGEFLKLTNNYDFCHPCGKKVSTSFTHFSYVQSLGKIMVTDLQGWLPTGSQNLIYLTDPQFHTDSGDSSPFDFGQEGMKVFFDIVHPECNEICKTLKLERPKL